MIFKDFFFNRSRYNAVYGSRLQNKIFLMFGVLASIPAFILTILAIVFSYYMINSWFNAKITSVLNESAQIAESYLKENQESMKTKAATIANELDANIARHDLQAHLPVFTEVLNSLVHLNDVSEAVVFQGRIPLVKSQFGNSLSLEHIPDEYYLKALQGKVSFFKTPTKIRAIIALHAIPNTFLVVGKYVDEKATEHIQKSTAIIDEYNAVKKNLKKLQFEFCLAFFIAALALLCMATVMGRSLSKEIMKPIIRLVEATNSIKDGNFNITLPDGPKNDEIGHLSRSFKLMAQKVREQQNRLRQDAWSDIARRIAHEIKNPLTPIYLGAERIKEKYSKYIKDKKTFHMYVNTIMKHSQDIGTIVEEFSKFARMPAPVFKRLNLSDLVEEVFFSHQMKEPNIKFEAKIQTNIFGFFDATQIRQVLVNLIKNSEESIKSIASSGIIKVTLHKEEDMAHIEIEDSGKGFDPKTIDKIFEPYFTTKTKGTGLGLAIVKKIVDDHKGKLIMSNTAFNTAVVSLSFPVDLN